LLRREFNIELIRGTTLKVTENSQKKRGPTTARQGPVHKKKKGCALREGLSDVFKKKHWLADTLTNCTDEKGGRPRSPRSHPCLQSNAIGESFFLQNGRQVHRYGKVEKWEPRTQILLSRRERFPDERGRKGLKFEASENTKLSGVSPRESEIRLEGGRGLSVLPDKWVDSPKKKATNHPAPLAPQK